MITLLIIITTSYTSTVHTEKFNTIQECESAKTAIEKIDAEYGSRVAIVCLNREYKG